MLQVAKPLVTSSVILWFPFTRGRRGWIYNYLYMQSMPIAIKLVSSNPVNGKVYSIQHYVIQFVSDLRQVSVFTWYLVSSTNKTDRHDITDILLIVALNTITPNPKFVFFSL